MRIHVTYTGGTIGMVDSPKGLIPGADLHGWLSLILKGTQLGEGNVTITDLDPLIDSSNATPDNWQAIIDDLWMNHDDADAFVVLHGTDTMSYSAAALSYALTDFGKPVVLTGSQLPLGMVETDATANVTGALNATLSHRADGVTLFFGHHLFAGNRVTKSSSWAFEGFSSPATGPLARTGAPWRWYPVERAGCGWADPQPYTRHDVVVLDMVPGITAERLSHILKPRPEAVLLRAYGVGNVPSDEPGLTDVLREAIEDGVPVIVASQCEQSEVLLGHYETGDAIARAGAVGAGDMTLEAAYAKIVFLLSQGLRGQELASWVCKSIAGELTPAYKALR
ncbi:asparaginase [Alloscardovia macacae]|uniref:L-asparaginase 1 n=1 Tax=Alloscardovia macacae TaxID=1160091 RepID=A0A261F6K9_9BIFI|nr:asparaginase [Alloscardovia macacae]OZG54770.1 L-asparaginase 1 [Alloscardovia macacae]